MQLARAARRPPRPKSLRIPSMVPILGGFLAPGWDNCPMISLAPRRRFTLGWGGAPAWVVGVERGLAGAGPAETSYRASYSRSGP